MTELVAEVSVAPKRLPFSYARRFGVFLSHEQQENELTLFYKGELNLEVLLEARRIAAQSFTAVQLNDDEFELQIEAVYQRDSSETQ